MSYAAPEETQGNLRRKIFAFHAASDLPSGGVKEN